MQTRICILASANTSPSLSELSPSPKACQTGTPCEFSLSRSGSRDLKKLFALEPIRNLRQAAPSHWIPLGKDSRLHGRNEISLGPEAGSVAAHSRDPRVPRSKSHRERA